MLKLAKFIQSAGKIFCHMHTNSAGFCAIRCKEQGRTSDGVEYSSLRRNKLAYCLHTIGLLLTVFQLNLNFIHLWKSSRSPLSRFNSTEITRCGAVVTIAMIIAIIFYGHCSVIAFIFLAHCLANGGIRGFHAGINGFLPVNVTTIAFLAF